MTIRILRTRRTPARTGGIWPAPGGIPRRPPVAAPGGRSSARSPERPIALAWVSSFG